MQPHPSLQHVAKQSVAKWKATKVVPRLDASSSPLYRTLAAQCAANVWVDDAAAQTCMCCGAPFADSFASSGRHHCRLLGTLVCDGCSTKRAVLPPLKATDKLRVCDAAYNMVRGLHTRAEEEAATSAAAAAARDENRAKLRAANAEAAEAAARDELMKGGSGAGGRSGGAGAAPSKRVAGANAAAGEAVDALRERGEKLGILGDKVADLGREAEDFAAQVRKLREKAEKQAGWFPF